jgi:hypothetical protein
MTPTFTVWQSLCMGNYGYSIPVMEINDDGVWVSNLPATTTQPAVEDPAPDPPPTDSEEPDPSPQPPTTTTTTIAIVPTTTIVEVPIPEEPIESTDAIATPTPNGASYTLFDAEWDGYPFEETILLLEERYPPGTSDKTHFRLSTAVDFLRGGGMVRALDNIWNAQ